MLIIRGDYTMAGGSGVLIIRGNPERPEYRVR